MEDFIKVIYPGETSVELNEDTLVMNVTRTMTGRDFAEELYIKEQILENDEFIIFPDKDENGNIILYKMMKENENE